MSTLWSKLETNRTKKPLHSFAPSRSGVCAVVSVTPSSRPGYGLATVRGPESNPVGTHARLAERWSQTENVEWSQEILGAGGDRQS